MTLEAARAKVRVALSRIEVCSDRHLVTDTIQEAQEALEYIQPGRFSESEAIKDLLFVAKRLHDLADDIAGIRGYISA